MRHLILLSFIFFLLASCSHLESKTTSNEDFNFDWEFHLGDFENIPTSDIDNKEWKTVRLPHDWSVEHSFTEENTAGATAFLPGGIGWYRKTFSMQEESKEKVSWIEFDGVYTNSEVWINGYYLGKRPYGYIPFSYDLTPHLKYNEKNILLVKVDRSAFVDCRWYPGSGIYRKVKLVSKDKLHIPQWGTFVSTPKIGNDQAVVKIETKLSNQYEQEQTAKVITTILQKENKLKSVENTLSINSKSTKNLVQEILIDQPVLWDTESPKIYAAITKVFIGDELVESHKTPFGIRHFNFDKNKGFFLNGKPTLLKGVCLHHDGGLVGAAVPKGVWKRRLQALKDAGCNAIRTAHNPPSAEFLDLCDEMGFLVQDEAFDEWNNPKDKRNNYNQQKAEKVTRGYTEHFTEWSERDVKSMVLRDRNHPSIIMWSIGNEIEWTYPRYGASTGYWGSTKVGDVNYYWDEPPLTTDQIKANFESIDPGDYNLAETAKKLSKWVKEIDTSRPVTANLVIPSVSNFSGFAEALDIVGLSYRQAVYDYCHEHYPDMVFLGTENWARYHEWKPVLDKPFISGIFLWTGINYMGESRSWPVRGSGSGLLDFAGFKKPSYHLFKSLWDSEPHIYITTQTVKQSPYKWDKNQKELIERKENWAARQKWGWQDVNEHWNYEKDDSIAIEVYCNEPEVELFLNGKSMGIKKLSMVNDHILKWMVPFEKGELTAKSTRNSVSYSIKTASSVQKIQLTADATSLKANAYDVVHFTAQLLDGDGNPVKHEEKEVVFEIDGDARLLGVDNGSPNNVQDYQSNKITTSNGKALMILQSNLNATAVKVKATCGEIESETITIEIRN